MMVTSAKKHLEAVMHGETIQNYMRFRYNSTNFAAQFETNITDLLQGELHLKRKKKILNST